MKGHPTHDDLAAFALGALDRKEERSVSGHVEGCERCATELQDRLNPAVGVLAESVEQLEPPQGLRQSLMATVHEEARGAEADSEGSGPSPERSRLGALLMRPATGLAVLALGAAGVTGYLVAEDGGPSTETIPLTEASSVAGGTLVLDDGSATLQMHGMDPLAKGDVYQVWVGGPSGVKPSAAFVPHEDGTATAAVPEAAGDVNRVMITRETMAGRRAPSLDQTVFDARLG